MLNKINLLNFNREMMVNFFINIGEKYIVANQIMIWIYRYFCFDFNLMTNISLNLRNKLNKIAVIKLPKFVKVFHSNDGVLKFLFKLDNGYVHTVCIPEKNRVTLCISTQIGCLVKCSFCYTSKVKFKRNLYVSEIIGQLLFVSLFIKKKSEFNYITNIVFMGMGEPLLNFNNVVCSIKIMLDNYGFSYSKRKIVLSTSGIVPAIYNLLSFIDIVLTISLHASNDKLRSKIMCINEKYNINSVLKSAFYYVKNTKASKGKLNIEYIMLDNVNDSIVHASELVNLLKNIPSKINLIPFNFYKNSLYRNSSLEKIHIFQNFLKKKNIFSIIRKTRGFDIKASCGQLFY